MSCILVIEDNPVNMKLAVFLLENAGHEVLQATNAEDGISIAREKLPKLILMDMQLPGMDGMTATHLLRQDVVTSKIKIVALTAFAMSGDREKFEAAGCNDFIAKPIRYQNFLAVVNGFV
jgi:two-component system cell cycle response regulator DivK